MAVNNSLVAKSKAQQNLGITEYLTKDAIKNQINKVVGGKNGQRFISAIVSAYNTNLHFRSARISRFFQLHFSVRVYSFHHLHSSDIITWSHSTIQRLVSRKLSSRWDIRDIFSLRSVPVSIRD